MKNVIFKIHKRRITRYLTPVIMHEQLTDTRQTIGIAWWRWEIYMAWGEW